jgi:hypothetical protein
MGDYQNPDQRNTPIGYISLGVFSEFPGFQIGLKIA